MIIPIYIPPSERFTLTLKKPFSYRFTCEHCGKTTAWVEEYITGSSRTVHLGTNSVLTEEEQSNLNRTAANSLIGRYNKAKAYAKDRKYKHLLAYITNKNYGKCPFCGKKQSWAEFFGNWEFACTAICVLAFYISVYYIFDIFNIRFPENEFLALITVLFIFLFPLITGVFTGLPLAKFLHKLYAKKKYTGGVLGKPKFTFYKD
jgi:hypothetical protein